MLSVGLARKQNFADDDVFVMNGQNYSVFENWSDTLFINLWKGEWDSCIFLVDQ